MNRSRLLLLGATAAAAFALHSGTAGAADPAPRTAWQWPARPENLKILPKRTPPEKLRAVMTGFTRSLGVRCSHCHVGEEGQPLSTYRFASDQNPKKEIARGMMKLVGEINEELDDIRKETTLAKAGAVNVECVTCHRGLPRPVTLAATLTHAYSAAGADSAITAYRTLRRGSYGSGAYDFREPSLEEVGDFAFSRNDTAGAIKLFELNMRQFPESGRVYERLARAYLAAGDTARAVTYYQRALNVDPDNAGAREGFRSLRRAR